MPRQYRAVKQGVVREYQTILPVELFQPDSNLVVGAREPRRFSSSHLNRNTDDLECFVTHVLFRGLGSETQALVVVIRFKVYGD